MQSLETFEKGIRIYKPNSNTDFLDIIFGSSNPGGDAGEQDSASIGSLYVQKNGASSKFYQKIANAGSTADWQENTATAAIGKWRSEKVSVVTNDTQGAGVRDVVVSPFADDDGTVLAPTDFVVGEYIISDADGTPALLEITDQTGDNVTFAVAGTALSDNDTFIVTYYLPDADTQENKALVNYNGSTMVKIGDVDWNVASGISLGGSLVDRNGPVSPGDNLQVAIEKLEGDAKDLYTLSGVSRGSTSLGIFANSFFSGSQTIKQILQFIENKLFINRVTEGTGLTTSTDIVDEAHGGGTAGKFLLYVFETATPANLKYVEISYVVNSTSIDYSIGKIQKVGANFNSTISMTSTATNYRLNLNTTEPGGISYKVRRIPVIS